MNNIPTDNRQHEVFEKCVLVKIFHNQSLQDSHLELLSPNVFSNAKRRLVLYVMKRLKKAKLDINISNIVLFCNTPDEALKAFLSKSNMGILNEEDVVDIINDTTVDSSERMFDIGYKLLIDDCFQRFVEIRANEIKSYNQSKLQSSRMSILSNAKAIWGFYNKLYKGAEFKRDQLQEAMDKINSPDEYITTSSRNLNSMMGGFTRGYVDVIIGKSGHGKSSWVDYNILHTLLSDKAKKVVKITPEEDAATQWRRYIAMICKISTTAMRMKTVPITKEHIEAVKKVMSDRLVIYDKVNRMADIMELSRVTECDQLYVDHLQKIVYPGNKNPMENMIGNIPGLIGAQEQLAKQKGMSIIDLSQVGDKEIARSERFSKRPRYHDAYGSSVLYQTSREMLAVYYPFKDYDEEPNSFIGQSTPTIYGYEVWVEKSSYGRIGKIKMNFDWDYNKFTDAGEIKKTDYIAKNEPNLF